MSTNTTEQRSETRSPKNQNSLTSGQRPKWLIPAIFVGSIVVGAALAALVSFSVALWAVFAAVIFLIAAPIAVTSIEGSRQGKNAALTYLVYGGMGREQLFKTSGENFTKHSDYSSLKKGNSFCYIDLKKLLTTAPTADLLQMFIGEKAKAFHVLQSLSFTTTNLDGKMSLKIDSKENSLKTLADLFAALR